MNLAAKPSLEDALTFGLQDRGGGEEKSTETVNQCISSL